MYVCNIHHSVASITVQRKIC